MSRPSFLQPEVVPFVDVEIIRIPAPDSTPTPVVDVALAPQSTARARCATRCWWYWIGAYTLKCRHCGHVTRAER